MKFVRGNSYQVKLFSDEGEATATGIYIGGFSGVHYFKDTRGREDTRALILVMDSWARMKSKHTITPKGEDYWGGTRRIDKPTDLVGIVENLLIVK